MSSAKRPEPPLEILEAWQKRGVPLDDEEGAEAAERRAAIIGATGRAIRAEKQRRKRRTMWGVGLAAAASVVAALGAYQLRSAGSTAPGAAQIVQISPVNARSSLEVTSGVVTALRDGRPSTVGFGAPFSLSEKDGVELGEGARATMSLPRGVKVGLSPSSRATLVKAGETEQRVALALGEVSVSVPKPGGPRTFVVATPDADVVVHGTIFTTRVERLTDGTRTVVTVSRGAVLVVHGDESDLVRPGQSWASRPEPAAASGGAAEPAAPSAAANRPESVAVRGQSRAPRARATSSELAEQNRLFQKALDARASGDDAAVVVELDRLLTRFPDSELAQEARLARFRALSRLGRTREAAREARRYLSESPDGPARDEARDLLVPARPQK